MKKRVTPARKSELRVALGSAKAAFVGVGMFSGLINILMLTGALFMLEVYDRVLPSRSLPTLVALCVLATMLFTFQALLDIVRARLLVRIGSHVDAQLGPRVYDATIRLAKSGHDAQQPLRDLDAIRSFVSGAGPAALFDLPWVPLYLAICFAFHVWIGMTALTGAALLVALTVLSEVLSRAPVREAAAQSAARSRLVESSRRNAEAILAMGMLERFLARWSELGGNYRAQQRSAHDVAGGLGAAGRALRTALQSGVLAVGAWLVIQQEATGGIMIASSILAGRALAPIDLAIAQWRGFVAARQSGRRLNDLLASIPGIANKLALPAPAQRLAVQALGIAAPGTPRLLVQDVDFALKSGQAVGVVGPSGSGKSTLARALVGVWPYARGAVRLDGAAIDQWMPAELGPHIGYLPQDIELFDGTVAENIARFDRDASDAAVIDAAKAAGVHDLIVSLPAGYETPLGDRGAALSAGQRQRIALARALYGEPFLVVLDEPNSNLDADGEQALASAILGVRARGGIVVIIAHRQSALAAVDHVLLLNSGRQQTFGLKDDVLTRAARPVPVSPTPLKLASQANG